MHGVLQKLSFYLYRITWLLIPHRTFIWKMNNLGENTEKYFLLNLTINKISKKNICIFE